MKVNNNLEIIQLSNPGKDILEVELNKASPVVLTDCFNNWKDYSLFSLESLLNIDKTFDLKLNRSISEQEKTELIISSNKNFLDWIQKNIHKEPKDKFYLSEDEAFLKKMNLYKTFDSFANYYLSPCSIKKDYPIWIGCKGTKTGLHWDTEYRNIICQLYGIKKITLFSPKQGKYMYPSNKYDRGGKTSSVDFWNIDHNKFPEFNKAKCIEIILHPGQMLYIPKYWWHCIENITTSISISIRSYIISDLMVGLPEYTNFFLHQMGLYKKNNCTCHN